jgi:MFS family permease
MSSRENQLLAILCAYFITYSLPANMMAFFLQTAKDCCSASPTMVGFIYGLVFMTACFVSPFAGLFITKVGAKRALEVSLLLLSATTALFGMMHTISGFILWRIMMGLQYSVVLTSVLTILMQLYHKPQDLAYASALQETASNLGYAVSPMLGAVIYDWGGFSTVFQVFALELLASALFVRLVVKQPHATESSQIQEKVEESSSIQDVNKFQVVCCGGAAALTCLTYFAIETVLVAHVESCLLELFSASVTGMLTFLHGISSMFASLSTPRLMRSMSSTDVIRLGLSITAICCTGLAFSDPYWIKTFPSRPAGQLNKLPSPASSLLIQAVLMFGWGLGYGWAVTPVIPKIAEITNAAQSSTVAAATAACFNFSVALGNAAGPLLGGFAFQYIGFPLMALCLGIANMLYAVLIAKVFCFGAEDTFRKSHGTSVQPYGSVAGQA